MKRYISLFFIIAISLFLLCGCKEKEEAPKNDIEEKYMSALNNELEIVEVGYYDENEVLLFSEIVNNYSMANHEVTYTILDIDNDNENEMVIHFGEFYLILNYSDGTMYGYVEPIRGLQGLREDGTYYSSGGGLTGALCRATFKDNKMISEYIAEQDYGDYKINDKAVTEAEFETFMNKEYYSKKEAEFKVFSKKYIVKIYDFIVDEYQMIEPSTVGASEEGYTTTLSFVGDKVYYYDEYWGDRREGEYDVYKDGTLVISYTVNSIDDYVGGVPVEKQDVIVETYKIKGDRLVIQSVSTDSSIKEGEIVYELVK